MHDSKAAEKIESYEIRFVKQASRRYHFKWYKKVPLRDIYMECYILYSCTSYGRCVEMTLHFWKMFAFFVSLHVCHLNFSSLCLCNIHKYINIQRQTLSHAEDWMNSEFPHVYLWRSKSHFFFHTLCHSDALALAEISCYCCRIYFKNKVTVSLQP